ncbi:MAG: hypothetical protein AB7T02_07330, partial [Mesotoga sp.]
MELKVYSTLWSWKIISWKAFFSRFKEKDELSRVLYLESVMSHTELNSSKRAKAVFLIVTSI